MKKKILFVLGTRPEAIKMAPVIRASQQQEQFATAVCTTGQHREMLQQVFQFFQIQPDYDLDLMQHNQTLFDITAQSLKGLENVFNRFRPDVVLVQGDTTTAMSGALAAYYQKIPLGHVEAGLRSGNMYAPYPEEVNRKIISTIASLHFAPTVQARENLEREQYDRNVYVTGNTVIDALLWGVQAVRRQPQMEKKFSFLKAGQKVILVTAHRRESFGAPFEEVCTALLQIARENPDYALVYPVHLNPNVQEVVYQKLGKQSNIYLIEPLDYQYMIWLMDRSSFVITDSGGIQEEAPSLGKPVLVLREVTERQEGVEAGTAVLVGTRKENIVGLASKLIHDATFYEKMSQAANPYGDGTAAKQIVSILTKYV